MIDILIIIGLTALVILAFIGKLAIKLEAKSRKAKYNRVRYTNGQYARKVTINYLGKEQDHFYI